MLIILLFGGMNGVQTFRKEVLPDPVPPEISMFISYCIAIQIRANIEEFEVLLLIRSVTVQGSLANFLMVMVFQLAPYSLSQLLVAL